MPPEVSSSNTAILEKITQENIFLFRIFLIHSFKNIKKKLLKLVFHKICHSVIKILKKYCVFSRPFVSVSNSAISHMSCLNFFQ